MKIQIDKLFHRDIYFRQSNDLLSQAKRLSKRIERLLREASLCDQECHKQDYISKRDLSILREQPASLIGRAKVAL